MAIINGAVVVPGKDPVLMDIVVEDGKISGMGQPGSN